jgi:hypothetical protein
MQTAPVRAMWGHLRGVSQETAGDVVKVRACVACSSERRLRFPKQYGPAWSLSIYRKHKGHAADMQEDDSRQQCLAVDVWNSGDNIRQLRYPIDAVLSRHAGLQAVYGGHGPAFSLASDELCDDVSDAARDGGFLVDCSLGRHQKG